MTSLDCDLLAQIMVLTAPANQTIFRGDMLPEGIMKGLSEIYIINNMGSSVLILLSILIYSRVGAALAVTGSTVGFLSSVMLGANNINAKIGLWGYNPALTMMALGGIFMASYLNGRCNAEMLFHNYFRDGYALQHTAPLPFSYCI